MPRLADDPQGRARISAVLHAAALVIGILLGAAGVWILVTSDSTKDTRVGVLVGIWGALFAAYALIGRREQQQVVDAGGELVARGAAGIDTLSDARAVREYEQRLQAMLRHEIQQTLGAELAALRSEVASLRSEVVEKVGGELRLERIETTRVIGSDIEALQREVRQLKSSHFSDDFDRQRSPAQAVTVDADVVDGPARPAPRTVRAPHVPEPARTAAPQPFVPPVPAQPSGPVPPLAVASEQISSVAEPPVPQVAPASQAQPPESVPSVELTAPVPLPRDLSSFSDATAQPSSGGAPQPNVPGMPEPALAPEAFVSNSYWQAEAERHSAPIPPVREDDSLSIFTGAPEHTYVSDQVPPFPSVAHALPVAEPAAYPSVPLPGSAPGVAPWSTQAAYSPPQSEPAPAPAGPAPEADPAPEPDPNDPFAALPRIRPFTEFDLDPIEAPSTPVDYGAPPRHASDQPDPGRSGGGRRRRDDAGDDDVLSRILQRERGN